VVSTAVKVTLDDAMVGRLPPVCVMTGERADGYAPMVVPKPLGFAWLLLLLGPFGVLLLVALYSRLRVRYVVSIPMSDAAFERWHRAQAQRLWLSFLGGAGLVAAVALVWLGGLALLIALASVAALALALRAHLRVPWLQPTLNADRAGRTLTMLGVHDRFAAAVAAPSPHPRPIRSVKRNGR
jgi:hypothetical protein